MHFIPVLQKGIQLTPLISALITDTLTSVLIIHSHQAIVATLVMNFISQVTLLKKNIWRCLFNDITNWFCKVPYVCETLIHLFLGFIMQLSTI